MPHSPKYIAVQGSVGVPTPTLRQPEGDQAFINAVREEFPTVVARQALPAEAPPTIPHLALQSTTSQLAVSATRADFQKRFYGDYVEDSERCHEYLERKLRAVLQGWRATPAEPTLVGVVLTLHFSFTGEETSPVEHIVGTQLHAQVDPAYLQDVQARLGMRLDDKYFATLNVSNYEIRTLERPILPGQQAIEVKAWEGRVEDYGIELVIDVNNRLQSVVERAETPVSDQTVTDLLALVRTMASESGPAFVENGTFAVDSLLPEGA
jgi:hypothetical protein